MKWLIRLLTNRLGANNTPNERYFNYHDIYVKVFYNDLSSDVNIQNYLYSKLINIIQNEYNVKVFVRNNFDDNDNDKDASGLYIYLKGLTTNQQRERTSNYYNETKQYKHLLIYDDSIRKHTYPRIEILNDGRETYWKLFTLCHELGHHLIELRGLEQSEDLANELILEIFKTHFDPMFLGIFHTMLEIKTKTNKSLIVEDYGKHYIEHYFFNPLIEELKIDKYCEF